MSAPDLTALARRLLARAGHAVGLMDGDIYGPSLPTMLGLGSLECHLGRQAAEGQHPGAVVEGSTGA